MMQNCLFVNSTRSVIKCARRTKHCYICLLSIDLQKLFHQQVIHCVNTLEEHITRPELPTPDTLWWHSIDGEGVPVLKGMYGDDIMPVQSWLRDNALQMSKV